MALCAQANDSNERRMISLSSSLSVEIFFGCLLPSPKLKHKPKHKQFIRNSMNLIFKPIFDSSSFYRTFYYSLRTFRHSGTAIFFQPCFCYYYYYCCSLERRKNSVFSIVGLCTSAQIFPFDWLLVFTNDREYSHIFHCCVDKRQH